MMGLLAILLCIGLAAPAGLPEPAFADLPDLFARRTFGPPDDISEALAVGDLNGDGALDLVVGNTLGSSSIVLLNDGQGNFYNGPLNCDSAATDLRCFGDPTDNISSLALGDLDGDGDLDIVAGKRSSPTPNVVYLNDGSANFYRGPTRCGQNPAIRCFAPEGSATYALALADVDGQQGLDIILGNSLKQNSIFLNDGTANFAYGTLTCGLTPRVNCFGLSTDNTWALAVADLDGQHGPDIVVGNYGGQNALFLNQGSGVFHNGPISCGVTPHVVCIGPAGTETTALAVGRVDTDAHFDIVIANGNGRSSLLINDGVAGFSTIPPRPVGPAGNPATALALVDLDNDGLLDIVLGNQGRRHAFYLNNGNALFSDEQRFGSQTGRPAAIAAADFDHDGDLDLAIVNRGLQNELYLNNGAGSFAPQAARPFGAATDTLLEVAAGDLNGDGRTDLAVVRSGLAPVIYLAAADGSFGGARSFGNPGMRAQALAIGDLDNDNDLDIVVAGRIGQSAVFLNNGAADFTAGPFVCGVSPGLVCFGSGADPTSSVMLADVDNNESLDIITGNGVGQPVVIYLNDGSSRLHSGRINCEAGASSRYICLGDAEDVTQSIVAGDIDQDGDQDIVVGNARQPNRIYLNRGGGSFAQGLSFGSGVDNTSRVALADVNGDGRLDIAVGNQLEQSAVYLNQGDGRFANGPLLCNPVAGTICFGGGLDQTAALATADFDNDGDLDLATGNLEGQSALYLNDGTGTAFVRRTFGAADDTIRALASADLDQDGDEDLITGRTLRQAQVYLNGQVPPARLPYAPPQLVIPAPGDTPPGGATPAPDILATRLISISYKLSGPASFIRAYYSPDGGGRWLPARTATGAYQVAPATPGPDGSALFVWDTFASGFFGQSDQVRLRFEAYPAPPINSGAISGYFQRPYSAATSAPLRVRGAQVQVVNRQATPVAGAQVYRLPAGQSRDALAIGQAGTPFVTDSAGYLQGRGELTLGDRLVALYPAVVTDTYTLYHTSAPITIAGTELQAVERPGVQQLVVSAQQPLLLFNLDIALEWDARNDPAFLSRLRSDLRRASEILYDWSDGQVALGTMTLFHDAKRVYYEGGWDLWSYANLRIYATNRLRPNADRGGIVITGTVDPDKPGLEPFTAGQLRMGAIWNRFGQSDGTLGEDWPRTLAHELGHYLLFLDDNYLGLNDAGVLVPVSSCRGAMADPYRDDYSEFHPRDGAWERDCTTTLSERERGRADWQTITTFYPQAGLRAPASYDANPGPGLLPLDITLVEEAAIITPTRALAAPFFSLEQLAEGRSSAVVPGSSARAFRFSADRRWLTDLGRPVIDRVEARGAEPGDMVCVFEPDAARQGCVPVTTGNQPLLLTATSNWRPEVTVTPVTSTTLAITLTNLAASGAGPASLPARIYPVDRPAPEPFRLNRVASGVYSTSLQLETPVFVGYLYACADEACSQSIVVDYTLGGNPGRKWSGGAPQGSPGRKWSGGAPRSSPGRKWSGGAPVISGDGQVILYTTSDFAEGEFYAIQTVAEAPDIPGWAVRVGQVYRITATKSAPALDQASLSVSYLSRDLPDGAERWLRLYYWDGTGWQALPTIPNQDANILAAPSRGQGLYAIFATVPLAPFTANAWNQFNFPVAGTRPVDEALAAVAGSYTLVYGDDDPGPQLRWRLYAPQAPDYVNDLQELAFNQSYYIYVTEPITLTLKPATSAATLPSSGAAVPAAFYGTVTGEADFTPTAGMAVVASINGIVCGRGETVNVAGQIVYRVLVEADSIATVAGCGAPGRQVSFTVGERRMVTSGVWDNNRLTQLDLKGQYGPIYLPVIRL